MNPTLSPYEDSNPALRVTKPVLFPLSYKGRRRWVATRQPRGYSPPPKYPPKESNPAYLGVNETLSQTRGA